MLFRGRKHVTLREDDKAGLFQVLFCLTQCSPSSHSKKSLHEMHEEVSNFWVISDIKKVSMKRNIWDICLFPYHRKNEKQLIFDFLFVNE